MQLSRVFIDNYRCFARFETQIEDFTVIIGRNNTGKTSFLRALELLFHPGSDRAVSGSISRDDFRWQDKDIVIVATFRALDTADIQAFFSLQGSPGVGDVGIRLEAKWQDGEIIAERFIIRPDKAEQESKVERYTQRYRQFVGFSYVSPYRLPEQIGRLTRGGDYRAIASTYAGDFLQPVGALLGGVRMLHRQIQDDIGERGGLDVEEYRTANEVLNRVLGFVDTSPVIDPTAELSDRLRDSLLTLGDDWVEASSRCLRVLREAVEAADGSITRDIQETYADLTNRVSKLLQRCQVQFALLELRNSVTNNEDFRTMRDSLSTVLNELLPEMPPSLQPFPIEDDRLLDDVLVQLGDTDLHRCGSGYQSTFCIGLRIARVLAEVSRGVKPRLLLIAIEEPEAHLHPHKQRHLMEALQQIQHKMLAKHDLRIQMLLTSHSSNILSALAFEKVIVLRTKAGVTEPTKLEREAFLEKWLDELQVSGTNKRMRAKRVIERWLTSFFHRFSETLFARFIIILEGYSEIGAFPVWARHLPPPNNLDQLGVSLIVGDGAELSYAARLLDKLRIDYLLVCDQRDQHDLSGLDPSRVVVTDHGDFEEEILAVLPMQKVLRAIEATLTEPELDGFRKLLTSRAGVPALSTARTWDEVVQFVAEDQLSSEDLSQLKRICRDREVGGRQRRRLLKGADIGALLGHEAETVHEIPPVYWRALKTAQESAQEILSDE